MLRTTVLAVLILSGATVDARAGSVRLWSSAVVVDDTVRLDDLCELRGFAAEKEGALARLLVTEAPSPGGSRVIHIGMIRSVLASSGTNMATVTLGGATQCTVLRPTRSVEGTGTSGHPAATGAALNPARTTARAEARGSGDASTLRNAVIDYFNTELERYGGTPEVVFDRTSEQILDLSGPAYGFKVRRRNGPPLGLIPLEVDVLADGRTVQTVPLVVQVTMVRRAAVARRAINQEATIGASDLELAPLTFTRLNKLGVDGLAQVVGQRARRFIPAGSVIEVSMLESVPLVVRGQLVTLASVVGAIRAVTTGKAAQDGLLGEVVKIRAVDNKRVEFDAVVIGPGQVQIGSQRPLQARVVVSRTSGGES